MEQLRQRVLQLIFEEEFVVVEEQLEVVEELGSLRLNDPSLLISEKELGGDTLYYASHEEMDHVYGAIQGMQRFFSIVSTIHLDDFIIEFGAWCNG